MIGGDVIKDSIDLLSINNHEARELLDYLHKSGIVDLGDVEKEMRRKEKEERVKQVHPYAISKMKTGWATYVPDDTRPEKRKKIIKVNREDLLDSILDHYSNGCESPAKDTVTLTSLYPKWRRFKALHVKETCISRIDRSWQSYYRGTSIAKKPVRTLTKLELDEWAHRWIKEKSMTKTEYYNMSLIMRQVLDYAVDLDILYKNPFRDVKVNGRRVFKRQHKKAASTQVFTEDQVRRICELALDDFLNNTRLKYELAPLAVAFALKTGQRPSEVCADRYEDIELDKLHVQRMLELETGRVNSSFKGTFDAFDERYVYLTTEALSIIDLCRQRQIEKGVNSNGYIFSLTDDIGSGLWEAMENRIENYSLKVCGERRSLTKARKTYISTALDAGISPDTVRRAVGHRDIQTTLNRYYFDRTSELKKRLQFTKALDKARIFSEQNPTRPSLKEKPNQRCG